MDCSSLLQALHKLPLLLKVLSFVILDTALFKELLSGCLERQHLCYKACRVPNLKSVTREKRAGV